MKNNKIFVVKLILIKMINKHIIKKIKINKLITKIKFNKIRHKLLMILFIKYKFKKILKRIK